MNSYTSKITKYILYFFAFIFFSLGLFFVYNQYFKKDIIVKDIFVEEKIDQEFNKKQQEVQKYKENLKEDIKNNNNKPLIYKNCLYNDKEYKHGSFADFFSKRFVAIFDGCHKYQIKKRCDNGNWLGDSFYSEQKCSKSVDCQLEDGSVIKNGQKKKFYFFDKVSYGKECEDYVIERTCNNTYLKGDSRYKFTECKVTNEGVCKIGENILPDGKSHLFYSKNEVNYKEKCQDFSKLRICTKGTLYGDKNFKYWNCIQKNPERCFIDGVYFEHNQNVLLYSKKTGQDKGCKFFSQYRKCQNGTFDNQKEYKFTECIE